MLRALLDALGGSQRDRILSGKSFAIEAVDFGGQRVHVRALSAAEHLQYNAALRRASATSKSGKVSDEAYLDITAKLLVKVCCDRRGRRIFTDLDADKIADNVSVDAMQQVVRVVSRLSGATQEQVDQAEDEVKKAQSSASHSG